MEIPFAHAPHVDFGNCRWCKEGFEYNSVEVEIEADEGDYTLTDVPQGYSPSCGSRVYKAGMLERIEAINGIA
jgi:hypothetical protein